MHIAECDFGVKIPTTNTLVVAHHELGTMFFSTAPAAQIERDGSPTQHHKAYLKISEPGQKVKPQVLHGETQ